MASTTSTGRGYRGASMPRSVRWDRYSANTSATLRGSRARRRRSPLVVRMVSWCAVKSNSISTPPSRYGMSEVVSPTEFTYSVVCHQWFIGGARARRVFPTICVHMCSVSRVACQAATGSSGQSVLGPASSTGAVGAVGTGIGPASHRDRVTVPFHNLPPGDDARVPRLLVVHHTPSPAMQAVLEAVKEGVALVEEVELTVRPALSAGTADLLGADGVLLGTPANIGYMSGALKHFFDTVYYPCLDATVGLPYGVYVHGNDDTAGALNAILRITGGLRWKQVAAPLSLVGPPGKGELESCRELAATVAVSL